MSSTRRSAILAALSGALLVAAAPASPLLVRIEDGPVQGHLEAGVRAFTGIPFAAPPVGELRFRAPQPVQPWTTPLAADRKIPNCIQFGGENGTAQGSQNGASEDCLYLSVWAPADAARGKPLPVMFWMYGSGFSVSGPGGYDGAALARHGVIVVTSNYRLGLMAHMAHPSLDRPGELSGNYNVRDNQAALRWVQRNIAAFGGDPDNVTIFGQSAGGLSVMLSVVSPAAKGLFQKAIAQSTHSGAATERAEIHDRAAEYAGPAARVVEKVGCAGASDVAACLRAVPYQKFVDTHLYMSHVTDPALLPPDIHAAIKTGNFNRVPMIFGNTALEGAFYIGVSGRKLGHPVTAADLPEVTKEFFGDAAGPIMAHYAPARYGGVEQALLAALSDYRLACANDSTRNSAAPYIPMWAYEMTEPSPEQKPLDPRYTTLPNVPRHGSDVNYVFGGGWEGPFKTERARTLSETFMRYWTNFAKYGSPDPTGSEWPRWTVANQDVLNLQVPPVLSTDFAARHQCAFMKQNGFTKY